jgi:hypothetical protein
MRLCLVLVCCLAACGDDGVRHTPDATPHDGPGVTDAPADASGNPVTITMTAGNGPVAGVHVYFQNADSSVVLATTTNAAGQASAVMAAGGSVTAINPYTPPLFGGVSDEIDTFLGVKPGDQLHLALGSLSTSITVNVTANVDPAAAVTSVYTPCGGVAELSQGSAASVSLTNCGASTDFLIVSYDQTATPLNEAFAPAVAISNGANIDLTSLAFTAVPTRTYTYMNPGQNSYSFRDTVVDAQGPLFGQNGSTSSTTTGPMPTFTNAGDVIQTTVYPGGANEEIFVDWAPYTDTYTTDAGARMLPLYATGPSIDTTTHTVSFTEQSGGVTPDFVYTVANAYRQADARSWVWRLASPHATTLTFPTLPTDVYDFNFRSTDNPGDNTLLVGKVPGGYDAVRPFLLSQKGLLPQDFVVGASGSVTLQQYVLLAAVRGDTMAGHAPVHPHVLPHRVR